MHAGRGERQMEKSISLKTQALYDWSHNEKEQNFESETFAKKISTYKSKQMQQVRLCVPIRL